VRDRLSTSSRKSPTMAIGPLAVLRTITLLAFAIMFGRVLQLQVIQGERYSQWADQMRFREISLPAPRGVLYDRDGQILVRNIPSFRVSIVPADMPDDEAEEQEVIAELVRVLQLTDDTWLAPPFAPPGTSISNPERWEVQALSDSLRDRARKQDPIDLIVSQIHAVRDLAPYTPVVLKTNISRDEAFVLEENHVRLRGLHIDVEPLRLYTTGELTSHLLGYVGPIPAESYQSYYKGAGYDPDDRIGLTGLELTYEDVLRGTKGVKNVEVDVAGREMSIIGEVTPPTPGNNLYLTIDLELQRAALEALEKGLERYEKEAGVVVAMNPTSGEILAMVSLPTYDNNLFTGGISWRDYERLSNDKHRPLVNHAIGGQYPPGSVFKIVPASGGLQDGVITEHTRIRCDGTMYLPNQYFPDDPTKAQPFYCWIHKYGGGHGNLNIIQALSESCDIFFYTVGGGFQDFQGLGLERLADYARAFGFGEPSGIDLPTESSGLVPSARWKRLNYAESWVTGDTYNMAIGQGFVLATPLQVLNSIAAIANDGLLMQPRIVQQITGPDGSIVTPGEPRVIRQLPVSEEAIRLVQQGLVSVVQVGTGQRAGLAGITVAAKTGTAEFAGPRDRNGNLPTHAWFAAYAPAEAPEIAVVAFVYDGGEGSEVAAPIAADVMSAYFGVPRTFVE
jgi:penicillin-binding protein 2